MKRSHSALSLVVLLVACGSASEPTDCCIGARDPLVSAQIDGRPVVVSLDAWKGNGLVLVDGPGRTVSMIAYRPGILGAEGMQFWLDGFHGVGAYPVTGDGSPGTSWTVYWKGPLETGKSYWGDTETGDTVWVASYDTLTREIEGRFSMRGWNGDTVRVTNGHYHGTLSDYVPSP